MKLNKLAAAVALVAASTGANAAWDFGGSAADPGNGVFFSGELLFVAFNASTDASDPNRFETFYQDLGDATGFTYDIPGFSTAGSPTSLSFNVGNAFSNMSGDNLRWTVYGRTSLDDGSFVNSMIGSTSSIDPLTINTLPLKDYNSATGFGGTVNNGDSNYGANTDQFFNVQNKDAQEQFSLDNFNSATGFDVTAALGETLNFAGLADNGTFTPYGTWTFDGTTIEFSAIPVPAAAWLFGSALLGLAGAARRRKA